MHKYIHLSLYSITWMHVFNWGLLKKYKITEAKPLSFIVSMFFLLEDKIEFLYILILSPGVLICL